MYGLPLEYLDKKVLKHISKGLGELQAIDDIIADEAWGDYARFCIMAHPLDQLPREIEIQSKWGICKKQFVVNQ